MRPRFTPPEEDSVSEYNDPRGTEDCFDEGAKAALNSVPESDCPYPEGSPEADAWIQGHQSIA